MAIRHGTTRDDGAQRPCHRASRARRIGRQRLPSPGFACRVERAAWEEPSRQRPWPAPISSPSRLAISMHPRRSTSSTSASSVPRRALPMPSSWIPRRSRSRCEASSPGPILHQLPSPASTPQSGSTPPMSRPLTTCSRPTATRSPRLRSTARSDAHSPLRTLTATTSPSMTAPGSPDTGRPLLPR